MRRLFAQTILRIDFEKLAKCAIFVDQRFEHHITLFESVQDAVVSVDLNVTHCIVDWDGILDH